ncbi:F-box and WD40 domain protein, putative [Talaromyces stipitatus ATCC 10500]|uniref:Probable E3 ubiquitin ligase complex SCF subunit sconB n=1 Tax=Talaromyces stipitatus (strain ATCC 10500 / CBS 375.48 / QM 6759 / NRRL 1006) TaxID=441959 RepID=B8M812_TALSN|nr:F-box and WD40 domain protein, putative [Talaromyces stipitatus ATCC 10500]EED19974.1 F-box and WD40 domain protein, putative [Talaromyces stipitatus ATCC 10500]
MTPHDSYPHRSARRRPSLLLRARPKTAGPGEMPGADVPWVSPGPWAFNASCNNGDDSQISLCQQVHEPTDVFEEISVFPEPPPRHRSAKSFSSIRHGVDGLRALGRRLSVTIRGKGPKHNLHVPSESDRYIDGEKHSGAVPEGRHRNAWFKGHSINRRPSLHSVSALHSFYAPTANVANFIPGMGFEPPVFSNDLSSGAAARAAAAAQNEMAKRSISLGDSKIFDSESGIGIDLRDRSDLSDCETVVVRLDPVAYLPAELISHIFSFLSPASLVQLEAVSKSWNKAASSHHVWRNVFRQTYGYKLSESSSPAARKTPSAGLGKILPNQDWKKMAMVRKSLDQRWKSGKAAAIYLKGHTDTVYCVQFDEHKIITGSRDRTIRIWDAHYPWSCLKVIGAPATQQRQSATNNTDQQPSANPPFLSICAPSQQWADVVDQSIALSDCHNASILCLQYDDEIMVTGSSDFTCIIWDVKNDYKPIRRLVGHRSGVLDCCFDDRYIISCSKDTTICVWDRGTGKLVKKLLGHRGPVNAIQLRGDLLVSASGDGVAKLWNISSGLCVKEFSSKDHGLACVEFTEDGRTILAGGNDKVIYQYDANSGDMVGEVDGHNGLVRSLHLDSLNNRLISGSYDFSVKVFDATTGKLSIDFPGWTTSWILSAKSDYRRIVATSQDSSVVIMDFGYGLDGIELLEE